MSAPSHPILDVIAYPRTLLGVPRELAVLLVCFFIGAVVIFMTAAEKLFGMGGLGAIAALSVTSILALWIRAQAMRDPHVQQRWAAALLRWIGRIARPNRSALGYPGRRYVA